MNMKYLFVALAASACLLLAACSGNADSNRYAALKASPVVATVNGQAIHKATLHRIAGALAGRHEIPKRIRKNVLDKLIRTVVLAQKARQKGLDQQADVQALMRIQVQSVLAGELMSQYVKNHEITKSEIKARYKKKVASMDQKEYKARHILVKDKKTAEQIIAKLDNGADFATLAKKKSIGPSGKAGGQLGWFKPSDMVDPFAQAVKKLNTGEFTEEPVKSRYGWHVILLEGVRPVPQTQFKNMKQSIKRKLRREQMQDFEQSLRNQADIKIMSANLAPESTASKSVSETPKPSSTSGTATTKQ